MHLKSNIQTANIVVKNAKIVVGTMRVRTIGNVISLLRIAMMNVGEFCNYIRVSYRAIVYVLARKLRS
jgi:hypothetical protein